MQIVIAPATHGVGRTGFVVGRKALRRAVDRNRLKRLLREFLRTASARVCNFDLVIRLKRPIAPAAVPEAAVEAAGLITRALDAHAGAVPAVKPSVSSR